MPKPRPYLNGKNAAPQAGDERDGAWPREQLLAMNERFVERMQRAIRLGLERADHRLWQPVSTQ